MLNGALGKSVELDENLLCGGWNLSLAVSRNRLTFPWRMVGINALLLGTVLGCCPSFAGESTIRNLYGEMGMIDMPSARMAADGDFAFTVGSLGNTKRFSFNFQALPWLDTSFRFSRIHAGGYDRSLSVKARLINESDLFPEVSMGIRDILGTGVYSAEYLAATKQIGPFEVTAGLGWGRLAENAVVSNPVAKLFKTFESRDAFNNAGTVATKTFFHGPNVGLFGGLSWQTPIDGLIALAEYSSDKYSRDHNFWLGQTNVHSPINVGLAYKASDEVSISASWVYGSNYGVAITFGDNATSNTPSALKVGPQTLPPAIRSDSDKQEALEQLRNYRMAFQRPRQNAAWIPPETTDLQVQKRLREAFFSETRGVRDVSFHDSTVTINASLTAQPEKQCASYAQIARGHSVLVNTIALNDLENPRGATIFCSAGTTQTRIGSNDRDDAADEKMLREKLRAGLSEQSLGLTGLKYTASEVWVYYENYRYLSQAEAAGRVVRVLMRDAPPSVELLHLIPANLGLTTREIVFTRSGMERVLVSPEPNLPQEDTIRIKAARMTNPALDADTENVYPALNYSFSPKLTQHLFDPDAPIQFMVFGNAQALLRLAPGLNISAEVTGTIWSNYTFTRGAGSELPHVRTDLLDYLHHGKYGISGLNIEYMGRLAPEVFFEVRGGLLEDMFAGAGGQVLWRPSESRFTFGADMYQVWQREYHRLMGLQDYHVLTGHVSMYYHSPWYDLNFAVHAGRYLAGDDGATFELTRDFVGGVSIGLWATFTNVPFAKFGEGSFDKGIIIHIPLEWGLPIFSQTAYDLRLNSLTRDGGQRLAGDDSLYGATFDTSKTELQRHARDFVQP